MGKEFAEKRPVGRPPKPRNPSEILEKEILGMVELASEARKFAAEQLEALKKDAVGVTNIKQRLEVAKTVVGIVGELTKTSQLIISAINKPGGGDEGEVDLAGFLDEQRK